jgi:outer membrane protein insertion porin family
VAFATLLAIGGTGIAVIASTVQAQAAVVRVIEVRGNERVDADTVRGNITIEPGKSFNNTDIDDSIKRLFATGLFSDVQIVQRGNALVVTVNENLIINQIVFNGNKKIKDKALDGIIQARPLGPYNETIIEYDVQAIKEAYDRIGRGDAEVTTQVVTLANGRVNVAFNINEGGRTKIAQINFVGNQAYGDGRLRDIINTKRSNVLAFLTRKDVYDPDKLRADEELLRRFYYNHGYADFQIVSATADTDPSTGNWIITFTLNEGERYTFGDVQVDSTVDGVDVDKMRRLIESRSGKVYSAEKVEDTIVAMSEAAAAEGYPFTQITPRGNRNFAAGTIDVTYLIDQGQRAYIERIDIRGNTRTADYVIRREIDLSEGDAFNQVAIQQAKKRLEALQYFESVDVSTVPGSEPDRVVVVVNVKDDSTGEFSIGAGYSTGSGGPTAELALSERNFLGRGQFIKIAVGGSLESRNYTLSFTEPYFLGYRLAAGFDIGRTTDTSQTAYDQTTTYATLRVTAPITNAVSARLAYTFSTETYDLTEPGYPFSPPILNALLNSPWTTSAITGTLFYNTIDNVNLPHEGIAASLQVEFAGLGGDAEYIKANAKASYFHTLSESADIVGQLSVGGGYVTGYNGDLQVFDQIYIGGETIRGFASQGIGPRDQYDNSLGGTTYFNATAEVGFPMPILPKDYGVRGAFFVDAATLYGSDLNLTGTVVQGLDMQWRASVGASLIWASPFGPLRLDFGFPILKEDFDQTQIFRFGTSARF